MPRHFQPHAFSARIRNKLPRKSSAHRIACLALYRALLEQCPRIPLPINLPSPGPINPIKHLIRKRFKRDVVISSPRLAVEALKVGYTAEQLLRTAGDGNAPALSKIHTLLRLQYEQSEHSRQVCQPAPPRKPPPRVSPYPSAPKLLDIRPLPFEKLSGLRSVPHLAQTNGYAFLRTRKPQSPYLARVLRDKIKQKDRRFNNIYKLDRDVENGNEEAQWEEIVMAQLEREGGGNKAWRKNDGADWGKADGSWVAESVRARMNVIEYLNEDLRRSAKIGERLTEVWEKEKKLWRQERGQRKYEKNVARKERKRNRNDGKVGAKDDEGDKGKARAQDKGGILERTELWRPIGHK